MAETPNQSSSSVSKISLDDFFQFSHLGSLDKAITNNLYGINHRQIPTMVPNNKDQYGLTFFTRPQLNLQPDNIRNVRLLYPLLTTNPLTIQRYVRHMLDPRLAVGYRFGKTGNQIPAIDSPLVDPFNVFIPILTNNLNTISGWPDPTLDTFSSKPGLYKEVYSMVDGRLRIMGEFDIDANFRNTRGDPILYMFYVWCICQSALFEGAMVPYLDFITENEVCYNTRIYRLVLDANKRYVTKLCATGASFPITAPIGSYFDFNKEKPFNDQSHDISIRFKCNGVDYLDDILIKEFNAAVTIFNPLMTDKGRASGQVVNIPQSLAGLFNNRGYPYIDPTTNELQWWVMKSDWDTRSTAFLNSGFTGTTTYEEDPNKVLGD